MLYCMRHVNYTEIILKYNTILKHNNLCCVIGGEKIYFIYKNQSFIHSHQKRLRTFEILSCDSDALGRRHTSTDVAEFGDCKQNKRNNISYGVMPLIHYAYQT